MNKEINKVDNNPMKSIGASMLRAKMVRTKKKKITIKPPQPLHPNQTTFGRKKRRRTEKENTYEKNKELQRKAKEYDRQKQEQRERSNG